MQSRGFIAGGALLLLASLSAPVSGAEASEVEIRKVSRTKVEAGQLFKITGVGFRERELWFNGAPILIGKKYATVVGWNDGKIYARAPLDLAPGKHKLLLRIGGVPGPTVEFEVRPAIFNFEITDEGIVVNGGAFGKTAGTVTYGGETVEGVQWSTTRLVIPRRYGERIGPALIRVTIGDYAAERYFNWLGANVSRVQVRAGVRETRMLVEGGNFGLEPGRVKLGAEAVTAVTWEDGRIVAVVPPELPAGEYQVELTVLGRPVTGGTIELAPVIRAMSYADGKPGDPIELYGGHFAADAGSVEVMIGKVKAEVTAVTPSKITLRVPAEAVAGRQTIRVLVESGELASQTVPFRVLSKDPKGRGTVYFEEMSSRPDKGWEEFGEAE